MSWVLEDVVPNLTLLTLVKVRRSLNILKMRSTLLTVIGSIPEVSRVWVWSWWDEAELFTTVLSYTLLVSFIDAIWLPHDLNYCLSG